MTQIEQYYDLLYQIDIIKFKISVYANPEEEIELKTAERSLYELNIKFHKLVELLNQKDEVADDIRAGMFVAVKRVLESFDRIKQWRTYFPDLGQGMAKGALFGNILFDIKIPLITEGHRPFVEIHMSEKEWDYELLEALLVETKEQLFKGHFSTKMGAINFYSTFRSSLLGILDDLRAKGVV